MEVSRERDRNLVEEVLEDSLAVDKFLRHETGGGQHGQASVLEFLGLHEFEFLRVAGHQSQRIKAEVAGNVLVPQKTGLVDGDIRRIDKGDLRTLDFRSANGTAEAQPEKERHLAQMRNGGSTDLGVEQKGGSFDFLADQEANSGQHGHAAVRQFCLTVSLEGGSVGLVGKAEGVEKANGRKGSDQIVFLQS